MNYAQNFKNMAHFSRIGSVFPTWCGLCNYLYLQRKRQGSTRDS